MGIPWVSHGYPMGIPWVSRGYPGSVPWVSCGYPGGILWVVILGGIPGQRAEKLLTGHQTLKMI